MQDDNGDQRAPERIGIAQRLAARGTDLVQTYEGQKARDALQDAQDNKHNEREDRKAGDASGKNDRRPQEDRARQE